MTDPRKTHKLGDDKKSLLWLINELGTGGLAGLFLRGGLPVYTPRIGEDGYRPPVREGDHDGPAQMQEVKTDRLITLLALSGYRIARKGKTKWTEVLFPDPLARKALTAAEDAPNLRPVHGVTHSPMVRADGSVLAEPGYDQASGYLYLPDVDVPRWWQDTIEPALVERASKLILSLIAEFPWCTEHDRANWLGGLLLPLLRLLAPPPYRLLIIDAHQPGSGKTLLGEVVRIVHGGVFRGELPHDEAELAKSIAGILSCTTGPVVLFDNATGLVKSSRLAALLTTRETSDRILGTTNETAMTNDRLWMLTANNARLGGDLVRRSMWARIDPGQPHPETRTGFAIPDLEGYVAENRGEILAALLVWVRAWVAAGRPVEEAPSDSYGASAAVVRGILAVAGVPGEFDHEETRKQTLGDDDEEWREFLEAVWLVFGTESFLIRELCAVIKSERSSSSFNDVEDNNEHAIEVGVAVKHIPLDKLPATLLERVHKAGGYYHDTSVIAKSLGKYFQNREGRWAGDLTCRQASVKGRNGVRWRLERIGTPSEQPAGR